MQPLFERDLKLRVSISNMLTELSYIDVIIVSFFVVSIVLYFCSLKDSYYYRGTGHISLDKCFSDNYIKETFLQGCLSVAAATTTNSSARDVSTERLNYDNNRNSTNLDDDFENNSTYRLSDGQTSPNGKWKVAYTGFGSVGVQQDAATGNHYFFEQPKTSTSKKHTYASMVLTAQQYSNFEMDLDMKTVAQLRQNSPPNTWETAWVFWHYTDEFHYYALALKTNGLQIEKKDNDNHDDSAEIYVKFSNIQKLKLNNWVHIKLMITGNHITLWADGELVLDFTDKIPNSPVMSHGHTGLYNEDAKVNFDNIRIRAISPNS